MESSPTTSEEPSPPASGPIPGSSQSTLEGKDAPRLQFSIRRWAGWGLLVFAITLGIGGAAGYLAGTSRRAQTRAQDVSLVADEQFRLGLADLEAGRYEIAKDRFEYVIQLDPNYPDAAQRLAEALLGLNQPLPTPTLQASPTPNLAPVEDLFAAAEVALAAEDWNVVIETLLALRAKDPAFRAVEADGMMYIALRNRGVQRIANEGMLEEGMYDLSLAERFGPLDRDAENWRSWAQLYLQANSYIGVNWGQATLYFAQVYMVAPYLRNDAYLKYATSARMYGDQLVAAGDPCAALEHYEASMLAWENGTLVPTATKAAVSCATATAKPPPPPKDTPTPSMDTPTASMDTPTVTPTETPTDTGGT